MTQKNKTQRLKGHSDTNESESNVEKPVELVDWQRTVRRPPTEAEIERARSRASKGGNRLSWAQVIAMFP